MALSTAEEVYQEIVRPLPVSEQLRLVERVVHALSEQSERGQMRQSYDWMSIRGIAPDLLDGEDAQAWVSRTRRESDEFRERQWGRE